MDFRMDVMVVLSLVGISCFWLSRSKIYRKHLISSIYQDQKYAYTLTIISLSGTYSYEYYSDRDCDLNIFLLYLPKSENFYIYRTKFGEERFNIKDADRIKFEKRIMKGDQ